MAKMIPLTIAAALTLFGGPALSQPPSQRVANFLCSTEDSAIKFSRLRSEGQEEEIAANIVGKEAGTARCGLYVGFAIIEEQKVVQSDGTFYRVTAFRFNEDHKLAWVADNSFVPDDGHSHGEGI